MRAAATQAATRPALPRGFAVTVDADTRELADGSLYGGSPLRVVRLSRAGRRAWSALAGSGVVTDDAQALLARRLLDAGLLQPKPMAPNSVDVTVVVPVRDRSGELDHLLTALGSDHAVIVVDDASVDAAAVAAVATRHGARVVRRAVNGGPAAARNGGWRSVDTELVAFVDSDCTPPASWIAELAGYFTDPLVGAVAPRIVPARTRTSAERYSVRHGCLDRGPRAAAVAPRTRVSFVPSAALVVRRSALADVGGFDAGLRYGEDVDLVWRLHARGWRVRYDAVVQVPHREPSTWPAVLARRYRYGTAAGGLALRHGIAVAPLRLAPWPTLALASLVVRRPAMATAGLAAAGLGLERTLGRAGLPPGRRAAVVGRSLRHQWLATARYARQFGTPVLLLAAARARGRTRLLAALLLLSPPDPRRLADDVSYGLGVVVGARRARTVVPLRPVLLRRTARSGKDRHDG